MNKKFLVVALMAALSTVGYANSELDAIRGEISNAKADLFEKIENDNVAQDGKFEGKLDGIRGEIGNAKADLFEKIENDNAAQNAEFDEKLVNKADKDYVDGKVTELGDHVREEMDTVRGEIGGVKAEVYENKEAIAANKTQIDKNTAAIENHEDRLTGLENNFAQYDGRLSGLEKKVDHLDDKMNKGLSLMAAMNAVDFQNVQTGEMAIGAGIGHYGNAQSVALGVAYAPVEDLTVNAKYSITAGDPDSFAVGAGATYKFKVGR